MNEKNGLGPRYEVQEVLPEKLASGRLTETSRTASSAEYDLGDGTSVRISFTPVRIDVLTDGEVAVTFNSRGLLNFEHLRMKGENEPEGMWEETFKTHADSKPKGPQSGLMPKTFLLYPTELYTRRS